MITPQEWEKRALELDREGFEVNVVGKPGRLSKERASGSAPAAVRAESEALALTITLSKIFLAAGAVSTLCHLLEHLLQDAAGHARASKRGEVTAEDIEEAWKRHGAAS